jgi:transmembrane 9 superfamily protein 3
LMRIIISLCLCFVSLVHGDDNTHQYTKDEAVTLWVNTIGPFHNPTEIYAYYDLPYCHPEHGIERHKRPAGLGEILEGYELRNSGVKMHFATNVDNEVVCEMKLTQENVAHFMKAVDQQYWYELVVDDLPMWGMVGEHIGEKDAVKENHIFTHRTLSISYNNDQIIEVNLTSENPEPIKEGQLLQFTYTVKWEKTEKNFEGRFDRYLEYDFFEHKVHWFSIFNSFMMVIFLCGLVAVILLRTLRNDFARYAKEDELDIEGMHGMKDDSGWKNVYGDVFRQPDHLVLFSAMMGTGWQLLLLILAVILYAMAGPILHGNMYEDRGEMVSTVIVCFALSSAFAGYTSGSFYRQYFPSAREEKSSQWQKAMVTTILLYPSLICVIGMALNMIAVNYETLGALPLSAILKMVAIWLFVSLPLAVVGTLFGRHMGGKNEAPCRVNNIPRPIPAAPWYARPLFVIPAAGLLPFGSIFIEMYFMFTSFWSYKFYYVYGFVLLVYIILVLVTMCTTVVAVYFVLSSENYHWQWLSFLSAGSTSLYVFAYSIFYFLYKTKMTGVLQISFYFGYMLLFCLGLFFMCGTVGVWGAGLFVRKIYGSVKID